MAKPGSDRDGTMVEKQTGKKSKDKISFTKTPKLDGSELLEREMKPKSTMKRKLTFTLSPQKNKERDSDIDSDPGHSSETWGEGFSPPCAIYTDKDGPEKKKTKKETASKKSTPVNILFGYPLSERKQMALLMQMTARDNSPDSTPSHPLQAAPVQKKISGSTPSRQKDKVNKRNERGETALHMAAIRGDVKQVKELISLGADANVKDFAGWTPLHEACNIGHYDVATVLIATGAEVNTQGLDDDTPLHDASSSGHKDIVRLLLRHGGNAFQANDRGKRPVDVADSKEIEGLLKGEVKLSDSVDSPSDSEGPSSADDNMEYSDAEKGSKQTHATKTTAELDEYEFKDEVEEDLGHALKDRHLLKRELSQRGKDVIERNHLVVNQEKSEAPRTSKSKKQKLSRIQYRSSGSSSDETSPERKGSLPPSLTIELHNAEVRTKKLSLSVEQKEKGKASINKNLSKNKENPELIEDRKENGKGLLLSTTVPGLETPEKTTEEDSFMMSFSPKDEDSVHLFPPSPIKSPKDNHSDKQSGPLKQEYSKLCMSSGDSPSEMDSVKYNHHAEPYNSSESSCSKGLKHKEKSKYHHKDLDFDGEEDLDDAESALQKTDKEGKVIKKHKLKHQEKDKNMKENDTEMDKNDTEKDKNRKENEIERDKQKQRDARKDSHRHLEFDRAFWKENFFKSDENEELMPEKNEMPESGSFQKGTDVPLVKEERTAKEKHSRSKDKKQKEDREKDKDFKKEKEEMLLCREEKGKLKTVEEKTDCHISNQGPVDSFHNTGVTQELEDNPISENNSENKLQDQPEKGAREKTEKRLPGRDRESEKFDKKHSDREKKLKTEYIGDKSELQNCTDKLKEREKATSGSSHSPLEKNQKESEKSKAVLTRKPEDNKKIKEKVDRKNEKEKQEKVRCPTEIRDKEKSSIDKKGKTSEKVAVADQGKLDRVKEKEKDYEKKKKDKIKDIISSSSNMKTFPVEKKSSVCENSKTPPDKTKQKEDILRPPEKDKRTRDKNADRHREGYKDKSQQTKPNKLKMNEAETNETKSKSSPAPKEARPKEKRLVNDDLMQTSFERMLSLKDQEIEQWHRKHKEKIKQKERERMKHQPVAELSKLKNKDKVKNSRGEPCLSKELLRSKSSDVSEAHSQEKVLKEATNTRSVSVDTKSVAHIGKAESDGSSLMPRSVSMISVASSEDSCQTAVLPTRPLAEYDSGFVQEGLGSQLCTIQSPSAVHENECDGFLHGVLQNRTSLSSRQEPPCSTADEDGKPSSTDGRTHELSWSGAPSSSKTCLPESKAENCSSQGLLLPSLSNFSTETPTDTGNEGTHLSPHFLCDVNLVSEPRRTEPLLKDSDEIDSEHAGTLLQTATETKEHSVTDLLFEGAVPCPQDEETKTKTSEHIIMETKESLLVDTKGIGSFPLSEEHVSSIGKVSDCCGEHQDVCTDLPVDLLQRAEKDSEQKENPSLLEDTPCCSDRKWEDQTLENQYSDLSSRARTHCEGSTSLATVSFDTKTHGMVHNTEISSLNASANSAEPKDAQENTDSVVPKDTKQKPMNESLRQSDLQSDNNEFADSTLSAVMESCQGAMHQTEENTLHEAQDSKERSGSLEISENTSLPVDTSTHDCNIAEVKPETCKEMMAFVAVPEENFQQMQQDTADSESSSSSLQGDYSTEHSNVPSGSYSPQTGEGDSDSSGAKSKTRLSEEEEEEEDDDDDDDIQLPHPRKRKMHQVPQSIHMGPTILHPKEKTQQSLAAIVDSLKLEEIEPYQTERANPYYEFLHIRRKIEEKRKVLCSVIPQAPQYYDEYVTFNGSYLLDGNPLGKLCIPTITPPPSLPEPLKEMFKQQEVVRMKLRLQHSIEREKLILSNEQEVLRVHYRAARTLANQALPFSACTVLLDAEVYNMPQEVQGDDCKTSVRDRFNARQFMSWLQDVDDKFDKLKTCLLMRQQHEAAALNAVQRLEWQLKLQELDPAAYKSLSIFQIPEFYVPLVDVSDDFELAPI